MWIDISNFNANRIFLAICYFVPIKSTSYKKNNLDKNFPFITLKQYIQKQRNEGNILLIEDFNARTTTNQVAFLSNNSNPYPLWLDKDYELANKFQIKSNDTSENLFGIELIKICSSQDLIICKGINKWTTSGPMTCIHGQGNNGVGYTISDTHALNCIVSLDLLNDHKPDSDHRPLSLTLNISMHTNHMQKNNEFQR